MPAGQASGDAQARESVRFLLRAITPADVTAMLDLQAPFLRLIVLTNYDNFISRHDHL